MNISDIGPALECQAVQGEYEDRPLRGGFTSDLLSDVMGKAKADSVLITIQAHKNTVAVASLAGVCAIVICSDRPVPADMVAAAKEEGVAVFRTALNQFESSGRIWTALKA